MNHEMGHLYHDSHYMALSWGVLEAREQMKAREVNAREGRLLRQLDKHLQHAKEACRKQFRWEQDAVRRDLRFTLQRTPPFDRTLQDEKDKLRRLQRLQGSKSSANVFPTENGQRNGFGPTATPGVSTVTEAPPKTSPPRLSSSKSPAPEKSLLPPVSNGNSDTEKQSDSGTPSSPPNKHQQVSKNRANEQQQQQQQPSKGSPDRNKCPDSERLMPHVKPIRRGQKYGPVLGESSQTPYSRSRTHRPLAASKRADVSASDLSPSISNRLGLGQYRGADLRRRIHHTVMAIVRVQVRHERRMREADAAVSARAFGTTRRYRFSDPSSTSLKELSQLLSSRLSTEDVSSAGQTDQRGQSGTEESSSKKPLSWLSLPVPDTMRRAASDVTGVKEPLGNATPRPARPRRLHSLE